MTVVQPNSIAGINSITVQTGNSLSIHKSDGSLIRTITGSTGVTTFATLSVGTGYTDFAQGGGLNIGLGASISNGSGNVLTFGTGGDDRATIDASGNISVGSAATVYANGNLTAGIGTFSAIDLQTGPFNVGTAATIAVNGNATFSGIVTATQLAGTLQTAAQSNITSLGTLTTLTVDNIIVNGTNIGHTDDTDLMSLSDGSVNVGGDVDNSTNTQGIALQPGGKIRSRVATTSSDAFIVSVQNDGGSKVLINGAGNAYFADGIRVATAATISTNGNATFSGIATATSFDDSKGDLRNIPLLSKSSGYTLIASDAGKCIEISTGGVTVPNSVMSSGNVVSIANDSGSNQTITQGSGVSLFNTGDASTGNRTLAGRGMATIWFANASTAYISGSGLS